MRARRTRLELRVELTTDKPRVCRELDDLDELPVGGEAAELHPVLHEQVAIGIRDLITMTMALAHFGLAVNLSGARPAGEPARIRAETHCAAHVRNVLL